MSKEKKDEGFLCPQCRDLVFKEQPVLSRRDKKTKICSDCGTEEAMFDARMSQWKDNEEKKILIEKEEEWLEWTKQ